MRFSRDKRGVEYFCLVQPTANRRGKVRQRVLYWYRSPPDVKVGREPFDPTVRRALEAQNPDVTFDWRAIVETPIPSADADKWRERRRAERAARHAAAAEERSEAEAEEPAGEAASAENSDAADPQPVATIAQDGAQPSSAATDNAPRESDPQRRRRRRRRGGRGQVPTGGTPLPSPPSGEPSGD